MMKSRPWVIQAFSAQRTVGKGFARAKIGDRRPIERCCEALVPHPHKKGGILESGGHQDSQSTSAPRCNFARTADAALLTLPRATCVADAGLVKSSLTELVSLTIITRRPGPVANLQRRRSFQGGTGAKVPRHCQCSSLQTIDHRLQHDSG